MDKEILIHKKFVEDEIAELRTKANKNAARDLAIFHTEMTRNFQHERAIHLAVTLFFAVIAIGSWVFCVWFILFVNGGAIDLATLPVILMTLILTVLEGFYIRHYYNLENRTQKLYALDQEIFEIIDR